MTLLLLAVCCALLLTALECANMFLDYNAPQTLQPLDVPLVEWMKLCCSTELIRSDLLHVRRNILL